MDTKRWKFASFRNESLLDCSKYIIVFKILTAILHLLHRRKKYDTNKIHLTVTLCNLHLLFEEYRDFSAAIVNYRCYFLIRISYKNITKIQRFLRSIFLTSGNKLVRRSSIRRNNKGVTYMMNPFEILFTIFSG